jgi:hypothetical protein
LTWGFSWSSVGHISRYYSSTWGWTSKLGSAWLINHPRDGITGGTYGSKRRYYAPVSLIDNAGALLDIGDPANPGDNGDMTQDDMQLDPIPPMASGESAYLDDLAGQVPSRLRDTFERLYASWQQGYSAEASPDSTAGWIVARPEFDEMVALGPDVVPLVMQHLANPDEWPALYLAEVLLPDDQFVDAGLDNPFEGEQGRARRTLENWLASMAVH